MMSKTEFIKMQCKQLKLSALATQLEEVIALAQQNTSSYLELVKMLLEAEINHRLIKDKERRFKQARLPLSYNLDLFDFSTSSGLEQQSLNQLRELAWLEQNFNLILMGPSGTGKLTSLPDFVLTQ